MIIQLVQINFTYGANAYLPYSVGLLQAMVENQKNLKEVVTFQETIFVREPIESTSKLAAKADVLALSCYIWNWEYSKELARKAKEINPKILIIMGGPQVPHQDSRIFEMLPYVDLVVVGEGEVTFCELIDFIYQNRNFRKHLTELCEIPGIVVNNNQVPIKTKPRSRIDEIDLIPSPYLKGTFNSILKRYDFSFQVSQETHRGCPYSCTFCDWGSATMQKVRRFNRERLVEEFRWMGKNKIEVLYNCDANYGLFKEDLELTEIMIHIKGEYGYPQKFRAAYAKNSNERIFEISKMLNDEGMSKGATLSLQSVDAHTLELIKRRNMKINDFGQLIDLYNSAAIPTYTELIVGLPGETKDSFKKGIDEVLEAGQHDGLNIYPAMVLPNAQLNDVRYRQEHGIETRTTPLLLIHGTAKQEGPQERYEIVVGTSTMPKEHWIDAMIYGLVVQALHCLNLTQYVARYFYNQKKVQYSTFYESLMFTSIEESPVLGQNLELIRNILNKILQGEGSLDVEDRRFGDIVWPVEEILFLRLLTDGFLEELPKLLTKKFNLDPFEASELCRFQKFTLKSPALQREIEVFDRNWLLLTSSDKEMLENAQQPYKFEIKDPLKFNSIVDYAREVVWYGRKGSRMRYDIIVSRDGIPESRFD